MAGYGVGYARHVAKKAGGGGHATDYYGNDTI
jgi:hypothetical protein